jgi:hypothetical protein
MSISPFPRNTSNNSISSLNMENTSPSDIDDIYNKFINLFYGSDFKVQNVILATINNSINHPAYIHLFKTMDASNAKYIMGYFRSQKSFELNSIIEKIVMSPLPTKDDFIINNYVI